ncbi:hypothetical protein Tco_1032099 [Tanacetum coccineum]|uniref:Uncharacterized protein n=1 Tax=Tanacetum coccineum TaxID=301880 RepID=A0ABQ5GBY9_9ASTR
MRVTRNWLTKTSELVLEDATEETLLYLIRAYLLYLIGSIILPDYDNLHEYPTYWLQFLKDPNPRKLNGVAWGNVTHWNKCLSLPDEQVPNYARPAEPGRLFEPMTPKLMPPAAAPSPVLNE